MELVVFVGHFFYQPFYVCTYVGLILGSDFFMGCFINIFYHSYTSRRLGFFYLQFRCFPVQCVKSDSKMGKAGISNSIHMMRKASDVSLQLVDVLMYIVL